MHTDQKWCILITLSSSHQTRNYVKVCVWLCVCVCGGERGVHVCVCVGGRGRRGAKVAHSSYIYWIMHLSCVGPQIIQWCGTSNMTKYSKFVMKPIFNFNRGLSQFQDHTWFHFKHHSISCSGIHTLWRSTLSLRRPTSDNPGWDTQWHPLYSQKFQFHYIHHWLSGQKQLNSSNLNYFAHSKHTVLIT